MIPISIKKSPDDCVIAPIEFLTEYKEEKGYFASDQGNIYSAKVPGGQGLIDYDKLRLVKLKYDKDGYAQFTMSYVNEEGKHKLKYIRAHRFIYETVTGEKIPEDMTIDHMNHDKRDNRISNLRILSREENSARDVSISDYGYSNMRPFKVTDYNENSELIMYANEIAEKYKISSNLVWQIYYRPNHRSFGHTLEKGIRIKIEDVEDIERISNW